MFEILNFRFLKTRVSLLKECKRPISASSCRRKSFEAQYDIIVPHKTSARKLVGDCTPKPSYWSTGKPNKPPPGIEIKTEEQVTALRRSCRLASEILKSLREFIKVGVTTDEIDGYVHELVIRNGAYPSPLNYYNYPKSVCTSVNNVACHGIPDSRPLKTGDILNVDVTVYRDSMHGDCSAMYCVGRVDKNALNLCRVTHEALLAGISVCKPGVPFSAIGRAIQRVAEEEKYTIVPAFLGHGIGSYFHGLPDIYHFDTTDTEYDTGGRMSAGMAFTVEPVLSEGSGEVTILEDGWTAVTSDGARTAQWEHTVLVTDKGVEVLTL